METAANKRPVKYSATTEYKSNNAQMHCTSNCRTVRQGTLCVNTMFIQREATAKSQTYPIPLRLHYSPRVSQIPLLPL